VKIAIITFWWSEDNYGQILQCYALQKYLRDMGHDAYVVRHCLWSDIIKPSAWKKILKVFNPIKLYKFVASKKRRIADIREKYDNPRNFEGFRNKYIKQSPRTYFSSDELVKNPPVADIYIVGSDQVWNTDTFGVPVNMAINLINVYLLNFGDKSIRRISYAASFGKESREIDDNLINIFTPLLKKFDYVSVREKTGLEICKRCGVDTAEWVLDPTMLLDVNIYRALYRDEKITNRPNKPYCFLYLLGHKIDISFQIIYDWAKSKDIEIVYVTMDSQPNKHKKTYATIPEWIYLLEHAEYVITNSYHCTIFSLLFKRKIGIITLVGKDMGMNSRFDTIFQLFGVEDRVIKTDMSILDNAINWQSISNTLLSAKNTSKLRDIVNECINC